MYVEHEELRDYGFKRFVKGKERRKERNLKPVKISKCMRDE
jgi:hypothetical protein